MLKFSSEEEALQHLADLTGKRIKVARIGDEDVENAIDNFDVEKLKELIDEGKKPVGFNLSSALQGIKLIPSKKNIAKEIVKALLDGGVKPYAGAYIDAIYTKDKDILKMLIEARTEPIGHDGLADVLKAALDTEQKEMAKMLIDAGAYGDFHSLRYTLSNGSPFKDEKKAEEIREMIRKTMKKKDIKKIQKEEKTESKEIEQPAYDHREEDDAWADREDEESINRREHSGPMMPQW